MFKYLKNYEINKFKNHQRSYKKYRFKFIDSKKIQYLVRLYLSGIASKWAQFL
jgi:hypothetical protein